jgi:hypothetical protein
MIGHEDDGEGEDGEPKKGTSAWWQWLVDKWEAATAKLGDLLGGKGKGSSDTDGS